MSHAISALMALFSGQPVHTELSQRYAESTRRLERAADRVVKRAEPGEDEPLTRLAQSMKGKRKRKATAR